MSAALLSAYDKGIMGRILTGILTTALAKTLTCMEHMTHFWCVQPNRSRIAFNSQVTLHTQ